MRLIDAEFEENHYASMLLNPTPDVTEQDKRNARIIIDALRMAKTVEIEPHWIPVTERLPKEFGSYQVTTTHGKVATYVFVPDSISSHEYWKRCVTAWMPLPEPLITER